MEIHIDEGIVVLKKTLNNVAFLRRNNRRIAALLSAGKKL